MRKLIISVLLVFSIFQIFLSDFYINYHRHTSNAVPELFYLPSAKFIKPAALSYQNVMASLIWVKVIGYFADQFLGLRDFRYLEKLLYIIADLDPKFEKVYLWGGSVLMYNGNWITEERINKSTDYLKYGWRNIKDQRLKYKHNWEYWRIPHMIGFNYAIELKDIEKGIPYIEELAKLPEAPVFYRTWLSTLYRKTGKKKEAIKNLETELIIENLRSALSQDIDESIRKQIIGRLRKIYRQMYDDEYAKKKIKELESQILRLRKLYISNFPYITKEMFFVIGANRVLMEKRYNYVDMLFYNEIL